MIPLVFIYSHDEMFQGVKQEASLFAKDKTNNEGASLFEQLVLDEAYLSMFRQLFFDAQAEVHPAVSAYLKDIPVSAEYFDPQDFSTNRDYTFSLVMPNDFIEAMTRSIDIKIKQFIIAYIMYRWLETKSLQDAAIYLERADKVKSEFVGLLHKRSGTIRRRGSYF